MPDPIEIPNPAGGPPIIAIQNESFTLPVAGPADTIAASEGAPALQAEQARLPDLEEPTISDLAAIIGELNLLAQTIKESEIQRATFARDIYRNIVQHLGTLGNQYESLGNLIQTHIQVVNELDAQNAILQPLADNENTELSNEQAAASAYNSTIDSYNSAVTSYENEIADVSPPGPPPTQQDYDDAVTAEANAQAAYDAADATYQALLTANPDYSISALNTAISDFNTAEGTFETSYETLMTNYTGSPVAYVDPDTSKTAVDAAVVQATIDSDPLLPQLIALQTSANNLVALRDNRDRLQEVKDAEDARADAQQDLTDAQAELAPLQDIVDAHGVLDTARLNLLAAQSNYNSFVATRNSGIAAYNSAQTTYEINLDSIQDLYDDVNLYRQQSGLPQLTPPTLNPPDPKNSMNNSGSDFSNLQIAAFDTAPSVNNNQKVDGRTSGSLTVDPLPTIEPPDLTELNQLLNDALANLFIEIDTANATVDFSNDLFEFENFVLKNNPDPTQLDALIQRIPTASVTNPPTTAAADPTPGAGIALATQVLGLDSPSVQSIMISGVLEAFRDEEGAPLSRELLQQIQLLIYSLLSINSGAAVKSTLGRLGIKGLGLAGNSQSVKGVGAVGQLEGILTDVSTNAYQESIQLLLASQPGLNQGQVQNLLAPATAALNLSMILNALSNLGTTIGAPALIGDLLQAALANDPNLSEIFRFSQGATTNDIIRNGLANPFLIDALTGDIQRITGAPEADAARIAASVVADVSQAGAGGGDALAAAVSSALQGAGLNQADATAVGASFAERVNQEAQFASQLSKILLDSFLNPDTINVEAILRSLLATFSAATSRIAEAIGQAGSSPEDTANVVRRALQSDLFQARQIREDIINGLIQSGFTQAGAIAVANATLLEIDNRIQGSNLNLIRLSGAQRGLEEVRQDIRNQFLSVTRGDLGARAEKIADSLDQALFGSTKIQPEREKEEIRRPNSIVNQIRDAVKSLTEGRDSRIADEIQEAGRTASQPNFDVTRLHNRATDPGTMLVHSILTGMSGSDAALAETSASKPAAPIGKNIDIPV